MTKEEFHTYFKVAIDKNANGVAFGGAPAFLPEEIDYWLDLALYQVIMTKYNGKGEKGVAFEKSIKRMHDLEGLIRTDAKQPTEKDTNCDNCVKLDGLTNSIRMLFVSARLNCPGTDNKVSKSIIRIIDHNAVERYKLTYNNTPWVEEPVAVLEQNTLFIYYDPVSMADGDKTVDITYIKYPAKVSELPALGALTELPDHVYHEVIDAAVLLALEDIQSQRTQTKSQLNAIDE